MIEEDVVVLDSQILNAQESPEYLLRVKLVGGITMFQRLG